ncbi:MAG TPA: pectinesterase family protein [Chthoniobacterales bacterium]|nr:pectinesterase family protein [Chthoniobacterales bacterium]
MALASASSAIGRDYFVNPAGADGAFPTVQSAVDAVQDQTETDRANIFIAPGRYVERVIVDKPWVTFIGQGAGPENVTISYHITQTPASLNEVVSIHPSATAFMARNLTFENSTPQSSLFQALATRCDADRAVFDNVRFLGYQDTLLVWSSTRQYFSNSFITGDADFIFGNATAVFDHCTIESTGLGYLTAADTLRVIANGLIFLDCELVKGFSRENGTTAPNNSVFLGRPWFYSPSQQMPSVIYIRTRMGTHITQAGWDPWNSLMDPGTNRDPFTRVSEWGSMSLSGQLLADSDGNGTPNGRVAWADPMTAEQAANYTLQNIFGPVDFWNATTQPESAGPYESQGAPWDPQLQMLWLPVKPGAKPQFFNISTRLRIDATQNVGIGGFIITGTAPKKVVVRAIGPSLQAAGLTDALADPVLTVHGVSGEIATNDNWQDDAVSAAELETKSLSPAHELESALVLTLAPGSYTAVVRGHDGTLGTALVEVYDGDLPADSQLGNISTLGFAGTGDNVLIAGVVIGGPTAGQVVLRAIGPSLTAFGVANTLQDPMLQLYDANGSLTGNDDWGTSVNGQPIPASLQPTNPRESALQTSLAPGHYTAIVQGKGATTGVALVEAYNLE